MIKTILSLGRLLLIPAARIAGVTPSGPTRSSLRRRIGLLFAALLAANVLAWIWAYSLFHAHPLMLGTALLAWGLGLRHAVDADHIAAIDNVTRKLMQDGQRPIATGFWFAIGHSGIIGIASVGIAAATSALSRFELLKQVGGTVASRP